MYKSEISGEHRETFPLQQNLKLNSAHTVDHSAQKREQHPTGGANKKNTF